MGNEADAAGISIPASDISGYPNDQMPDNPAFRHLKKLRR
jgi:hypothetical protein